MAKLRRPPKRSKTKGKQRKKWRVLCGAVLDAKIVFMHITKTDRWQETFTTPKRDSHLITRATQQSDAQSANVTDWCIDPAGDLKQEEGVKKTLRPNY